MKVSIKNLKEKNKELKNAIDLYENQSGSYYNYLNHSELNWYDENSKKYFLTVQDDKKEEQAFIQELNSIYNYYNDVISKYETIGTTISCNPEKKEDITNVLDEMIKSIDKIISIYNSIGIYNYSERTVLFSQKNNFMKIRKKIDELKHNLIEKIEYIEESEKDLNKKHSKLTISPSFDKDISSFM